MGLRCFIGHEYGDTRTSRRRDEQGDEVLVMIREFQKCKRCGHERTISENKEVRPSTLPSTLSSSASDPVDGPGVEETPAPTDSDPSQWNEYDHYSADEDDGVILESESDTQSASSEATVDPESISPLNTNDRSATSSEWPTHTSEDEGFSASGVNSEDLDTVEFQGGLTPRRRQAIEDDSAEIMEETEPGNLDGVKSEDYPDGTESTTNREDSALTTGIQSAGPRSTPAERSGDLDADTELQCPACGYTTRAIGVSLRSGDICPECWDGYLTDHGRED